MGRINRRAKQSNPAHVYIFTEQYSSDNRIYSEELRDRSLQVLTGLPMPLSEEDLNHAAGGNNESMLMDGEEKRTILDKNDFTILPTLARNCRTSYSGIGSQIGLTAKSVKARVS